MIDIQMDTIDVFARRMSRYIVTLGSLMKRELKKD